MTEPVVLLSLEAKDVLVPKKFPPEFKRKYNARRLHSSIAYMTPNEKEAAWHTDRLAA